MEIPLTPEDEQFIEALVKGGRFLSTQDVVGAALARLRQGDDEQAEAGAFDPGELDELIGEGEADIAAGALVDADDVFDRLRRQSAEYRQQPTASMPAHDG